jgi:hypothetical protein
MFKKYDPYLIEPSVKVNLPFYSHVKVSNFSQSHFNIFKLAHMPIRLVDKPGIKNTKGHLKNRVLVHGQCRAAFQNADIPQYVEDLKRGFNAGIGPKAIVGMPSKQ